MGLSTVQYFRQLFPKSTIIYGVPQWTKPIFDKIETDADVIYPLKLNSLTDMLDLWNDLIDLKVELIHEMHQSGRGKKAFSLFSLLKNIPYTFHNHHLKTASKVIDQGIIKSLIQRDLDGAYSFYGKDLKIPSYLEYEPKMSLKLNDKKKRIIFGVVATRDTKKWPLEHYKKLAQLIFDSFPQYEIKIPLSLSLEDLKLKEMILAMNFPPNCEITHWNLSELPEKFSSSKIYIGNDTGIKHLSVALGLKTITFFGAEPPLEWHPYNESIHQYFYQNELQCRTRTHHYCPLSKCDLKPDQNNQCLKLTLPETIFQEVKKLF